MSSGTGKISIWLSFSMIIMSAGLVAHVMGIPVILGVAERDSWLSVIVATPFFLLWMLTIYGIIKGLQGQRLPDWLQRRFGIIPAWIFRLSAVVLLFASGLYTLHDTSMWTVTTYMQQTPLYAAVVSAAVVAMLAAYGGLRTIAMTSSLLLPLVLALGYFVMISNTKYKDYSLLLPVLEHGLSPVLNGAFYTIAGLMEVWALLLYQHDIHSRIKWWQLILLGLFLIMMTLGPTIGAISEFGPIEAAKQRHTAFEQWKILSLGKLLQHVDFMSIYQWLCGSFARVALSLYLIVDMLDFRKPNRRFIALSVTTAIMVYFAFLFWRDDQTLYFLQHFYMPGVLYYVAFISVLLFIGVMLKEQGKGNKPSDGENRREQHQ